MTDDLIENLRLRAHWYALGQIEAESGQTGDPDGRAPAFAASVELDERTMHDRWQEFIHGGVHWHVQRHAEDDDPYVTYDVTSALDYAATELDRIADSEHDGGIAAGNAGEFEEAWDTARRVETWGNLVLNLRSIVKQYTMPEPARAPACRGHGAMDRLALARSNVIDNVNANGPRGFAVWQCNLQECRPLPYGEGNED